MDEDKVRERILAQTRDRIYAEGIGNFTMDDVAREAGVSKKTLYRLIPSKDALVSKVIGRQIDAVERRQKAIIADSDLGFQDKMDAVLRSVSDVLSRVRRGTVQELARLSPDLWETIRARRAKLLQGMVAIIEEGRRSGAIRTDLPAAFIAKYYFQMIDAMVAPQTLMELDMTPSQVLDGSISLLFHGITAGTEAKA